MIRSYQAILKGSLLAAVAVLVVLATAPREATFGKATGIRGGITDPGQYPGTCVYSNACPNTCNFIFDYVGCHPRVNPPAGATCIILSYPACGNACDLYGGGGNWGCY